MKGVPFRVSLSTKKKKRGGGEMEEEDEKPIKKKKGEKDTHTFIKKENKGKKKDTLFVSLSRFVCWTH